MSDRPPEEAREAKRTDLNMKIGAGDPLVVQMFGTLCELLSSPKKKDVPRLLRQFAVAVVAQDMLDAAVEKYRISAVTPGTCGCAECIWLPERLGTEIFPSFTDQVMVGIGHAVAEDCQRTGASMAGAKFSRFEAATKRSYCVADFRKAGCCETVLEQLSKVMPEVLAAPLGQQRKVETVAEHNAPADSNLGPVTAAEMRSAGYEVDSLLEVGRVDAARELLAKLSTRAGRQLCVTDFHQFVVESVHLESLAKLLPLSPEHLQLLVDMGTSGVPRVVLEAPEYDGVVAEQVEDQHTTKIVAEQQGDGP